MASNASLSFAPLSFASKQASDMLDEFRASAASSDYARTFYDSQDDLTTAIVLTMVAATILGAAFLAYRVVTSASRLLWTAWRDEMVAESELGSGTQEMPVDTPDSSDTDPSLDSSQPVLRTGDDFAIFITQSKLQPGERVVFQNGRITYVSWRYTGKNVAEFGIALFAPVVVHIFYRANVDDFYSYLGVGESSPPDSDLIDFTIVNPNATFVKCNRATRRGAGKYQRAAFAALGLKRPSRGIAPGLYAAQSRSL
jgi:hypothetical protein